MKQYKQGFKSRSGINLSHQYNSGVLDGIPIHSIKKINEKIIPIGKHRLVSIWPHTIVWSFYIRNRLSTVSTIWVCLLKSGIETESAYIEQLLQLKMMHHDHYYIIRVKTLLKGIVHDIIGSSSATDDDAWYHTE